MTRSAGQPQEGQAVGARASAATAMAHGATSVWTAERPRLLRLGKIAFAEAREEVVAADAGPRSVAAIASVTHMWKTPGRSVCRAPVDASYFQRAGSSTRVNLPEAVRTAPTPRYRRPRHTERTLVTNL